MSSILLISKINDTIYQAYNTKLYKILYKYTPYFYRIYYDVCKI